MGALVIAVGRIRRARVPGGAAGRVGPALIATAAVVGTLRNHLPNWVTALVDGWAAGFFLALDVFVVQLWRKGTGFRERIRYAVGRTGP